jgi:hypothetical protein
MLTFLSAFLSLSTTDSATLRQHWMEAVALSERHVVSGDNRTKVVQMPAKTSLEENSHSFFLRTNHTPFEKRGSSFGFGLRTA